jgi:hypothetical protein
MWSIRAIVALTAVVIGPACDRTSRWKEGESPARSRPYPDEATASRCPDAPQGDVEAHLAAVERARRDPGERNLAALENEEWTELWAVAARMGAEPVRDDWPRSCQHDTDSSGALFLNCYQERWGDAAAALELPALTKLACNVCRVGDLSPLGGHPRLASLFLSDTHLEVPGSLAALTNLTELTLQNTNVTGASHLTGLTGLRKLGLKGPYVHDLEGLRQLDQLTELVLSGTCLRDVEALRDLRALKRLEITFTDVRDLSALGSMTELEFLWLAVPDADRPPPFAHMKRLRELVWTGAALTDVSELHGLAALRSVYLDFHCVPDAALDELRRARPDLELTVGRHHDRCGTPRSSRAGRGRVNQ